MKRVVLPPARDRQKRKIERSASAALEVEVDGNVTVPLCVAFEVVIGFLLLLNSPWRTHHEASWQFLCGGNLSKDILVSDQVWLGVSVSL